MGRGALGDALFGDFFRGEGTHITKSRGLLLSNAWVIPTPIFNRPLPPSVLDRFALLILLCSWRRCLGTLAELPCILARAYQSFGVRAEST